MKTKEYYLTLPYREKIKTLRKALKGDIHTFLIIAKYYLDASVQDGGLPAKTIDREFRVGLKQKYYFSKENQID